MRVRDIMTTEVRAVAPEASLKEVASVLTSARISGLPVVDGENRVLGVVSEADILTKEKSEESGGRELLGWLPGRRRREVRGKLWARTAQEAMTQPAITVSPGRPVAEACSIMSKRGIKRLPVVDEDEKLIGIVTRADVVRAFGRPDAEIKREIESDVILKTLWISPEELEIAVDRGDVTLWGEVETEGVAEGLISAVAQVPGVLSVNPRLHWRKEGVRTRQGHRRTKARIEGRRGLRR